MADSRVEIVRGGAERPDATIETDPATLAAVLYDGRQLAEAVSSGDVNIEGDESYGIRVKGAARSLRE